jgi:hypothetical protein
MSISVHTRLPGHIITMKSATSIKEFHREENIDVACRFNDAANVSGSALGGPKRRKSTVLAYLVPLGRVQPSTF